MYSAVMSRVGLEGGLQPLLVVLRVRCLCSIRSALITYVYVARMFGASRVLCLTYLLPPFSSGPLVHPYVSYTSDVPRRYCSWQSCIPWYCFATLLDCEPLAVRIRVCALVVGNSPASPAFFPPRGFSDECGVSRSGQWFESRTF